MKIRQEIQQRVVNPPLNMFSSLSEEAKIECKGNPSENTSKCQFHAYKTQLKKLELHIPLNIPAQVEL